MVEIVEKKITVIPEYEVTDSGAIKVREHVMTQVKPLRPGTESVVPSRPTIFSIPALRIAIIGGHAHFVESIAAATKHSQSSALRNISWIQIKFPTSSETTLSRSIDDREVEGLTAAIILVDDWITEVHTYAARKCISRSVPCLFVQSKSDDGLENIAKTCSYGIGGYKEDIRKRLQIFGKQLNISNAIDLSSIYLINDTSLLLAGLGIRDASIRGDEMLLLSRLDALASGYR